MNLAPTFAYDDEAAALEDYFAQGFTDGLPVVPPTVDRVASMLAVGGLDPEVVLGEVPTRNVVVTAEKVAVNAVMAGCRPDYFPVVIAAVQAFLEPKANAHSTTATLAGAAHAVIVNGPVRDDLDIASGQACFGPGFRANATIGRALRLVIRNVCHSVPGELDRATFSWPLRYSFCFGEDEEASEWAPLHVQRGYAAEDSVVTLQSVHDMVQIIDFAPEPEGFLGGVNAVGRQRGMMPDEWCGPDRSIVLVVGHEHRQRLTDAGWTKGDVQEFLWPLLSAPNAGPYDLQVGLAAPDNILVVAAGGPGIASSWLLLPHLANPISRRIVR